PVHVAEVQEQVALAAECRELNAGHPVLGSVFRKITPAAVVAALGEDGANVIDAEARVGGHLVTTGVEARLRPAEVLEEDDLVAEATQADQVLQVVPRVPADRMANQVTAAEDLERRR